MKLVKYFDIHDKEVTPVVYTMFFAMIEIRANDVCYTEPVECWIYDPEDKEPEYNYENDYLERLKRGSNNCFHTRKDMVAFCENPPSYEEARKQCWEWLKSQGITEDDEFFIVKLWW